MPKFFSFEGPVRSSSSGDIKAVNSAGMEEIIHGFSDFPTGLVTEQMLPQDQRLLTVAPHGAKACGLLFNGADARVSWGLIVEASRNPVLARGWDIDGYSWTFNTRLEALELYDRLANRLREGCTFAPQAVRPSFSPSLLSSRLHGEQSSAENSWVRKSVKFLKWSAIAVAAFVLLAFAFDAVVAPNQTPAVAQAQQVEQNEQKALYTPLDAGVPDEARVTAQELEKIKALKGAIPMRESGIPVYVFADPNCSECLKHEKSLESLDAKYNPIMIPLGYFTGSFDKSSAVLCQDPASRARAWSAVMKGADAGKPCADGGFLLAANEMLFQADLRLNVMPITLLPSGILLRGSKGPAELALSLER